MKNIAILMGGYSSEFEISLASGNVVYDILKKNKKFNFYKIVISVDKWYHMILIILFMKLIKRISP